MNVLKPPIELNERGRTGDYCTIKGINAQQKSVENATYYQLKGSLLYRTLH